MSAGSVWPHGFRDFWWSLNRSTNVLVSFMKSAKFSRVVVVKLQFVSAWGEKAGLVLDHVVFWVRNLNLNIFLGNTTLSVLTFGKQSNSNTSRVNSMWGCSSQFTMACSSPFLKCSSASPKHSTWERYSKPLGHIVIRTQQSCVLSVKSCIKSN